MATKAKIERRQQAGARQRRSRARSASESMLRRMLANRGDIISEDDDAGLLRWLRGLNTPTEDHRSGWEKRLQARLEEEE
jgi:hypothetical protein